MAIRVFLVDDYPLVRTGLESLLGQESDFELIGDAGTAEEALDVIPDLRPDVVVLDYRLPGMSAVQLCRELAERGSTTAVVILSGYLDDDAAWACLSAGARAYVLKDADSGQLKQAIRDVAQGGIYLDPRVAARIVGWAVRSSRGENLSLSPAVRRVLRLALEGNSNVEIAKRMNVSVHTVKTQLTTAYRKLGVKDRIEAASIAVRRGLI